MRNIPSVQDESSNPRYSLGHFWIHEPNLSTDLKSTTERNPFQMRRMHSNKDLISRRYQTSRALKHKEMPIEQLHFMSGFKIGVLVYTLYSNLLKYSLAVSGDYLQTLETIRCSLQGNIQGCVYNGSNTSMVIVLTIFTILG